MAIPPAATSSAAAASQRRRAGALSATVAPALRPSAVAMASPMPRLPPVTSRYPAVESETLGDAHAQLRLEVPGVVLRTDQHAIEQRGPQAEQAQARGERSAVPSVSSSRWRCAVSTCIAADTRYESNSGSEGSPNSNGSSWPIPRSCPAYRETRRSPRPRGAQCHRPRQGCPGGSAPSRPGMAVVGVPVDLKARRAHDREVVTPVGEILDLVELARVPTS